MLVYSSFHVVLTEFFEQFRGKGIFALAQRVNHLFLMAIPLALTSNKYCFALRRQSSRHI
jgi:hypothetical protein